MSYRLTSTHQMIWLPCLLLGILLMIVGATEGVPYTSIHVRGESVQIVIGVVGLVLAAIGVYVGFEIGKKKK
jgi:putative Mn2+ efflux pump MntP